MKFTKDNFIKKLNAFLCYINSPACQERDSYKIVFNLLRLNVAVIQHKKDTFEQVMQDSNNLFSNIIPSISPLFHFEEWAQFQNDTEVTELLESFKMNYKLTLENIKQEMVTFIQEKSKEALNSIRTNKADAEVQKEYIANLAAWFERLISEANSWKQKITRTGGTLNVAPLFSKYPRTSLLEAATSPIVQQHLKLLHVLEKDPRDVRIEHSLGNYTLEQQTRHDAIFTL